MENKSDKIMVKCISSLGQVFDAELIQDDVACPENLEFFYSGTGGQNKFALTYDAQYDSYMVRKWGFNVFLTKEDIDQSEDWE